MTSGDEETEGYRFGRFGIFETILTGNERPSRRQAASQATGRNEMAL